MGEMFKSNRNVTETPKFGFEISSSSVSDSGGRSHDVPLLYMLQSPLNIKKSIRTRRVGSNPNLSDAAAVLET